MRFADLADKRVAIWGYGSEGRAALAAFRRHFALMSVTLMCTPGEAEAARALQDPHLKIIVDTVDAAALIRFDTIIKSPGISPYQAPIAQAKAQGVQFTSGTALWLAEHPQAYTICITATKGKSTTAAMAAHLLRSHGYCVALAGNIGLPLLALPNSSRAVDYWVIELSSFQISDMAEQARVGVIGNLYPEHIDWHGSVDQYFSDKLALATHVEHLVVNAAQPELLLATAAHPGRSLFGDADGWHVDQGWLKRGSDAVFSLNRWTLQGAHNADNACAALAALEAAGIDARALAPALSSFKPLPHRLQRLGVLAGIEFINDSIATTPYASLAALDAFPERPVTIILGGYDRGLDWSVVAARFAERVPHAIITQGASGAMIANVLRPFTGASGFLLHEASDLGAAVEKARSITPAGGVVLLSPGAPSFDAFHDYIERGRTFARLAGFGDQTITDIEGLGIA